MAERQSRGNGRAQTAPRWIRQRAPEPYPGAFREWVASIDLPLCCATHSAQLSALLGAMDTPAGLCLLCGNMGVWRQAWTVLEAAYTPRGCTQPYYPQVYYDLCSACIQAPDARARAEATLRLRPYAAWN